MMIVSFPLVDDSKSFLGASSTATTAAAAVSSDFGYSKSGWLEEPLKLLGHFGGSTGARQIGQAGFFTGTGQTSLAGHVTGAGQVFSFGQVTTGGAGGQTSDPFS